MLFAIQIYGIVNLLLRNIKFAITSLYKSAFSLRANIPYSFSRKRPNLFETSALMLRANIQIEITMKEEQDLNRLDC